MKNSGLSRRRLQFASAMATEVRSEYLRLHGPDRGFDLALLGTGAAAAAAGWACRSGAGGDPASRGVPR